jgi:hypothetical protein
MMTLFAFIGSVVFAQLPTQGSAMAAVPSSTTDEEFADVEGVPLSTDEAEEVEGGIGSVAAIIVMTAIRAAAGAATKAISEYIARGRITVQNVAEGAIEGAVGGMVLGGFAPSTITVVQAVKAASQGAIASAVGQMASAIFRGGCSPESDHAARPRRYAASMQ